MFKSELRYKFVKNYELNSNGTGFAIGSFKFVRGCHIKYGATRLNQNVKFGYVICKLIKTVNIILSDNDQLLEILITYLLA